MKKRKGFTLIELLAVIVVLAIIIAIAIPTYGKISKSIAQKQYKNKLELIKTAALKYTDETNYVAFFIKDLVDDGYLDADEDGHIVSNLDGTIMDCFPISITDDTGIKYAEIEEEKHELNNECDYNYLFTANKYIEIVVKDKLGNEVPLNNSTSWFKTEEVQLSLRTKTGVEIQSTPRWYLGTASSTFVESNVYTINTAHSVKNEIYKVSVKIKKGTFEKEIDAFFVINVDHVNPYFKSTDKRESLNNSWSKEKSYIPAGADNESGYYGSYLVKVLDFDERSEPTEDFKSNLANIDKSCQEDKDSYVKGKNITKIDSNGIYKVCLMDNVGNVTNDKNIIEMDHIDKLAPNCDFERNVECVNSNGDKFVCSGNIEPTWTNGDVTAYIPCKDQNQYNISGGTNQGSKCKKDTYPIKLNGTTDTVTVQMSDKVGNNGTCTRNDMKIRVDRTVPQMSVSVPNETDASIQNRYAKSKKATITIKDDGGSGLKGGTYDIYYAWGTTNQACSAMRDKVTVTIADGATNVVIDTPEIRNYTGAGKVYICNKVPIYDRAGNYIAANPSNPINASMHLDNKGPECSFSLNGSTTYKKNYNTVVRCNDTHNGRVQDIKYIWTQSTSEPTSFNTTIANNANVMIDGVTGNNWYLWVYSVDGLGNVSKTRSNTFYLDNTPPNAPAVNLWKWSNNDTTPSSSSGLASYINNSWSNLYVYTSASGSVDAHSKGVKYYVTTTGATTNVADNEATTRNVKANGISYIKYKACDALMNCSAYSPIYTVNIDTKAPKCGTSTTTWTKVKNENKKVSITCSEDTSKTNDVSGCTKSSYDKNFKATNSNKCINSGTITIKDNAGNTKDCNVNPKIDVQAPSVTCSGIKSDGLSNGLCSSQNLQYYYTCKSHDDCSGLAYRIVTWGGAEDIEVNNGSLNRAEGNITENDLTNGEYIDTLCMRSSTGTKTITVIDLAGNSTTK